MTRSLRTLAVLTLFSLFSGFAWAQEVHEQAMQQQMFIMNYIKEHPPSDSLMAPDMIDDHLEALEETWIEREGKDAYPISPYSYYFELRRASADLPEEVQCYLFKEQMVPRFLSDVEAFEAQPSSEHAYPIGSGFSFIINTGVFRCAVEPSDWAQLKRALDKLPGLIDTYLASHDVEEREESRFRDIQEELAALDPLLEVRDHLYRDNLNAAFAGLAAASTEGDSAVRLISLGKDLWRGFEEQGQTDMALATLDLLARSLTAADLPRDSLRVWYEAVDSERGQERFSQMTGDSSLPVLTPSGQEADLSGEYTNLTSGEPFDLSELDGRMVLFDFWATWCAPCIDDIPKLKELVAEYGDNFVLVTVSSDAVTGGADEEGVRDFMEKHGINYTVLFDTSENSLTEHFGVTAYPSKFLIDETGTFLTPPRKDDSQTVRLEEVAAFLDSQQ